MGIFSFHDSGAAPDQDNVERFGEPQYSLFTSSKVFTLHHLIEITDANENVVYTSKTKFPSILDKTDIIDANDGQVAHIEKKLLSLHERHFVTMADGTEFQISNEIMHIVKDVTNIEGLGWQLRGNILALNFELYDENENIIAVIGQKMLSIHDKYCVDIYKREYEKQVVAILITLQHMIKDREAASASSSSSSNS